eukprot:CAMPEP_0181299654 /NCGR_PEP_ID=MMETSP1101-20121128/6465_1 /TAXON_ID=46948 /ORGANISM="Rhodomonas abbreviata, Strain Caron Lab Isolate" /LENGTH=1130 /DNA_ID=CAMNT_0023404825 /DNA_START=156 /DNA_END=3545 /DNA_ORIENTATION=+
MEGRGHSLPTEEHLEKLKTFVAAHGNELRGIENFIDDSLTEVWDEFNDLVAIKLDVSEHCSTADLIATDNKEIGKIITTFAVLTDECLRLRNIAEKEFFCPLACFGERFDDTPLSEGDEAEQVAALIPLMERLSLFAARCHEVVANCMSQLSGLYTDSGKTSMYRQAFKGVHLQYTLTQLGELLRVLVTLDEIIVSNTELNVQWAEYKRMLQSAALEPEVFGISASRAAKLLMAVMRLEGDVFNGAMLRGCWLQELPWHTDKGTAEVRSNKDFITEMNAGVRERIAEVGARIGDATEHDHRLLLVGAAALFVVVSQINRGRELDSKAYKALLQLRARAPVVPLFARATWDMSSFLHSSLPNAAKASKDNRASFLAAHDDALAAEVQALNLQVSAWMVRVESSFSDKVQLGEALSTRGNLLIQGMLLARQIGNAGALSLALHAHTGIPLRQSNLRPIHVCCQMVKGIQATLFRKAPLIATQMLHIQRFFQQHVLQVIGPVLADVETQVGTSRKAGWKQEASKVDMLAMLTVMSDCLKGPNTSQRRAVINACWDMLPKKWIREGDVDEVSLQLKKLEMLGTLSHAISRSCDCSFLLWSRGLLPLFLEQIRGQWREPHQLHLLMAAVADAGAVVKAAAAATASPSSSSSSSQQQQQQQNATNNPHATGGDADAAGGGATGYGGLQRVVEEALEWEVTRPLCQAIETDLRLRIHSAQIDALARPNPFKHPAHDLASFLHMRPLRVLGKVINMKEKVAEHLDRTFYSLTAMSSQDGKTYAEMRNLAHDKFGLLLIDSYLPTGRLEQGLDVLEVMRNIHVFVARYSYHLHTQVFLEKPGANKYVHSIGIQQVANSIRTHGMGIMNTTVNFSYQFLARKLAVLSQFIFDDHIKSRLVKDVKYFREHREALGSRYPYERAVEFNSEIRRLGLDAEKRSYLDKFRILITEIGNALGFVRLIRAGGLNFVSGAVGYIPDLQAIDAQRGGEDGEKGRFAQFSAAMQGEGLSGEAGEAAANLDEALQQLTLRFAEGTDFFKLLVDVFRNQLSHSEELKHLKCFHVIVPPLIVNFVEFILEAKDRLLRAKRQVEGALFDDGFALGVAFVLKVLAQREQFDALHWFESVNVKLREEGARLERER